MIMISHKLQLNLPVNSTFAGTGVVVASSIPIPVSKYFTGKLLRSEL